MEKQGGIYSNLLKKQVNKTIGDIFPQKSKIALLLGHIKWEQVSELIDFIENTSYTGRSFYQFWRRQNNQLSSMVFLNLSFKKQQMIQAYHFCQIQNNLIGTERQTQKMNKLIREYKGRIEQQDSRVLNQHKTQFLLSLKGQRIFQYLRIMDICYNLEEDLRKIFYLLSQLLKQRRWEVSDKKKLIQNVRGLMQSMWKVDTRQMEKERLVQLFRLKEQMIRQSRINIYLDFSQMNETYYLPEQKQDEKEQEKIIEENDKRCDKMINEKYDNVSDYEQSTIAQQNLKPNNEISKTAQQQIPYSTQVFIEQQQFIFNLLRQSILAQVQCQIQIQANRDINYKYEYITMQSRLRWDLNDEMKQITGQYNQILVENLINALVWTQIRKNFRSQYNKILNRYENSKYFSEMSFQSDKLNI